MQARKAQSNITFAEIDELILKHLQERDWDKLPSRALAISLSLEANELLEHYQWSDEPVGDRAALAAELADIIIYAFGFAQINEIDMAEAVRKKLQESAQKYPAEMFKGKDHAERKSAWLEAKRNYQKEGL